MHDVVIADAALVHQAADAVQVLRSGAPGRWGFARSASETPIVVGDEPVQHLVGGSQIPGAAQAEFAGEAILESAPEAFDASFGLRGAGGDVGDAEAEPGRGRTA